MVMDLKGWELSNEKQKVAVKSFRGAKTSHLHLHAKPTIDKKKKIAIISGLVPRKGYLNAKVRNVNNRLGDYG